MADNLTVPARDFHERSKLKFAVSILTAAFGLMFLGFCSTSAGIASSYQSLLSEYQSGSTDDHTTNSYQSLIGSYGFSAFLYIVAFILAVAAALFISPFVTGSAKEKKTLASPQESESNPA